MPKSRALEAACPKALPSPLEVRYNRRFRAALPLTSLILPDALALWQRTQLEITYQVLKDVTGCGGPLLSKRAATLPAQPMAGEAAAGL